MKVKVIKSFQDKYTKEPHKKGSSFSCEKKRYDEIQKTGNFLEEISETKEKAE